MPIFCQCVSKVSAKQKCGKCTTYVKSVVKIPGGGVFAKTIPTIAFFPNWLCIPWEMWQGFQKSSFQTLFLDIFSTSCEIVLRWILKIPVNDMSNFVQVMAWCHQASSRGYYVMTSWRQFRPVYDIAACNDSTNIYLIPLFSWNV